MASGLTQQHVAPPGFVLRWKLFTWFIVHPVSVSPLLFLLRPLLILSLTTFGVFQKSPGASFFFFEFCPTFSYFLGCLNTFSQRFQNVSSPDFSKYLELPNGYCTQHLSSRVSLGILN